MPVSAEVYQRFYEQAESLGDRAIFISRVLHVDGSNSQPDSRHHIVIAGDNRVLRDFPGPGGDGHMFRYDPSTFTVMSTDGAKTTLWTPRTAIGMYKGPQEDHLDPAVRSTEMITMELESKNGLGVLAVDRAGSRGTMTFPTSAIGWVLSKDLSEMMQSFSLPASVEYSQRQLTPAIS